MILFLIVPTITLSGEIKKADEYIPLSYEEASAWLMTISYEQLIDFIIAYDYVEHALPVVTPAEKLILISGRDLHITEQEPMKINVGHLEYEIHADDEVYPDFIPKRNFKPYIYTGVGGVVTGILLMLIIGR